MELRDTLAVVTGATEGIGRAIAFDLGRAGARLAICARTEPNVRATLDALHAERIEAIGAACDVADPAAVGRFGAFVTAHRGTPDIIINNAGIGRFKPLEELSIEDWDQTMAVNVRSLFLVTRAFLAAMKQAGRGTIVNIASLAGRNGLEGGTAYCASKHAVLGFSKALMLEVRKHGLRVVAICPGSVATPFMDKQPGRSHPNREKVLTAEDVATTVRATLTVSERAMISELDIRPTNP
jgi:3-oxoacyl-[acyl-carrier protein] reductase